MNFKPKNKIKISEVVTISKYGLNTLFVKPCCRIKDCCQKMFNQLYFTFHKAKHNLHLRIKEILRVKQVIIRESDHSEWNTFLAGDKCKPVMLGGNLCASSWLTQAKQVLHEVEAPLPVAHVLAEYSLQFKDNPLRER